MPTSQSARYELLGPSPTQPPLQPPLTVAELSRGAKGLIRMDGDQTILEPPQADDTHGTGRSAGKRQQVFSFGKLLCAFEVVVRELIV